MSEKRSGSTPVGAGQGRVQLIVGLVTIVAAFIAVGMYLGRLEGRIDVVGERINKLESDISDLEGRVGNEMADRLGRLSEEVQLLQQAMELKPEEVSQRAEVTPNSPSQRSALQSNPTIFADGRLTSGLNMAVDSSGGRTDWADVGSGELCMRYPSGQEWGAVFITIGAPKNYPRPGRDFSKFSQLVIVARGEPDGTAVSIGIKDSTDPDDGSESTIAIEGLSGNWNRYTFDLSRFHTADIARLYVPTEFVFQGPSPSTVCIRTVEYAI